jgi:CheY-like chemotaxis protein
MQLGREPQSLCWAGFHFGPTVAWARGDNSTSVALIKSSGGNSGKKVLIVDDKATGRELVRTVLEKSGYEVFEASNGIDALDSAHRIRPDLIILDLHMPGLDGFGVIRELRLDDHFATIPIVALTASAMQGDRQRALSEGFTGYITKPVSLKALRAEVERLLA